MPRVRRQKITFPKNSFFEKCGVACVAFVNAIVLLCLAGRFAKNGRPYHIGPSPAAAFSTADSGRVALAWPTAAYKLGGVSFDPGFLHAAGRVVRPSFAGFHPGQIPTDCWRGIVKQHQLLLCQPALPGLKNAFNGLV